MKKLVLLAILAASSTANAFGGFGGGGIVIPQTVVGSAIGKTTSGAKAQDIYLVYCPTRAPYGIGYINDNLPIKPQGVTIQLISGLNVSSTQRDVIDGDKLPSGTVLVKHVGGKFLAYATKEASTVAGAENYTMTLGCYMTFSGGFSWVKPTSVKLYKRM
jgi:hypothetical protein